MTYTRYSLLFFISAAMLLGACSKLEDEPLQYITEEYLWDSKDSLGTNASLFLNNIYADMPNGFNRIEGNLLDAATDDAVPSEDGTSIATFTNGGYSPFANADNAWQKNYRAIRKANLFLANFHKVNLKSDRVHQGKWWLAEARFLRAMFYYELVKRYGGVPLIGDKVLSIEDDLNLPRNSFDECVQYVVTECDAVKDDLRADPITPVGEYGRITQAVALTLKAKILLLAASPLNNTTHDVSRWLKAKNAIAEVIRLNKFSLETNFSDVFLKRQNNEVILAYQRALTTDVENNNAPVGYVSGSTASRGYTSPTQDLVDAFSTSKGLPISSDIKSATNPTGYDAANPYANRDPRLSYTVFYNGMQWLGRPVETFDGGRDRPGGAAIQTKTGYYMRKFLGDFSTNTAYSAQSHNFPIFRYADILLMFAEAKNEVDGPGGTSDSIYTYIKAIRARAGIIAGTEGLYGLSTTVLSKDEMREVIRKERRVEMAFEEQRFWDLRRWKIAEDVYNRALHGIRITKASNGRLTYQIEALQTPFQFFAPRMYRYAIPYSEITKNRNLRQNEGYE